MWSIGCILAELGTRVPLFVGTTDIDQLHQIFSILGTPTEKTWPGYTSLQANISMVLPIYEKIDDLNVLFSNRLGQQGIQLLQALLSCRPIDRPSSSEALVFPFLNSIENTISDNNCSRNAGAYRNDTNGSSNSCNNATVRIQVPIPRRSSCRGNSNNHSINNSNISDNANHYFMSIINNNKCS